MSSGAHIWYQPLGSEAVVDIDLGRPLSRLADYDVRDESVSVAFSGARTKVVFTATRAVDVVCSLIDGTDYEVIRQLEALLSHLRRGGLCSISENDRTLGAFLETFPVSNSSRINYLTNLYDDYGNFTPLAGDILVLQGPSPKMQWEEVEVLSNLGGGAIVLNDTPACFWEDEAWVLVRNKGFWPALRLRADAPDQLLEPGNRITFDLTLPLEVPPNAFEGLAVEPDEPLSLSGLELADSLDGRANPSVTAVSAVAAKWW